MELIHEHPLWPVLRWPFWVATAIVALYLLLKVVYLVTQFCRGAYALRTQFTQTPPLRRLAFGTLIRMLWKTSFTQKDDHFSIFRQSRDPLGHTLERNPELISHWINTNSLAWEIIYRENPPTFVGLCPDCDELVLLTPPEVDSVIACPDTGKKIEESLKSRLKGMA